MAISKTDAGHCAEPPPTSVAQRAPDTFEHRVDAAIVGAGAAGLIAALAAAQAGATVMVFERDRFASGSTSLSAGLIPAAGTRWQLASNIVDNPDLFAADIINKSHCDADFEIALHLAKTSAASLHWLADVCQVPLSLVDGFTYPGHQVRRMHGTPTRTGSEFLGALLAACERASIDIVTNARVSDLYCHQHVVSGLGCQHGNRHEVIGADAVVLACNGYGANRELVRRHIPEIEQAIYFGHPGNTGDAVLWAQQLGAGVGHMSAYQGHGSVAKPHGILITWAVMMEGGIQVNQQGNRFSNEHGGYSEQAVHVLKQPGGIAWNIFDQRIFDVAAQFDDFQQAVKLGALIRAEDILSLASQTGLPKAQLQNTLAACHRFAGMPCSADDNATATDPFGRFFDASKLLKPPYYAVRVEAALFHTQGGVTVDHHARVLNKQGGQVICDGLYAAGGAAQGVSGDTVDGYLSGNGLLSAVTLGYLAGRHIGLRFNNTREQNV
ncbi:MAG: FAD-dependent oxidoreductase [Burkholderiaceae bacterium]